MLHKASRRGRNSSPFASGTSFAFCRAWARRNSPLDVGTLPASAAWRRKRVREIARDSACEASKSPLYQTLADQTDTMSV